MVLAAYTVFGLTGFGSTVLSLPVLALVLPLKFAVPMLMLLDLCAFVVLGPSFRRRVEYREIGWLLPFMLGGMALGLTLLIRVPEHHLLGVLGVFLLSYAGYGLSRRGTPAALSRAWCVPIGFFGGAFSALFGTGGVLFALYNAGRARSKEALRANNAATIMLSSLVRVVIFTAAGLLAQEGLLAFAALLVPPLLGGLWLGNRLHAAVPAAAVVKAVYALLVIAGLTLLARSI